MKKLAIVPDEGPQKTETKGPLFAKTIDDRQSTELVIALVGPVGSGCSTMANELRRELSNNYSYKVPDIISVSSIIRQSMHLVKLTACDKSDLRKYVAEMQNAGNALRQSFGEDYLSRKVVEVIHNERKKLGGYQDGNVVPKRIAYIIDSIKNTDELKLLRKIYRETLLVVGVFAPEAQRAQRLEVDQIDEKLVKTLFDRDQGEKISFGQATRKVFTQADWFVCNDESLAELRDKTKRFVRLCFNIGINTPTKAEASMYKANAVAGNSACLSRQVGAALVSSAGELIGVGWNDVPRFNGGLYDEDGRRNRGVDNRCYSWEGSCCHNEMTRNGIVDKIAELLTGADFVKKGTKQSSIREYLSGTPIDALIEFSRSIHAEMEAILSVGREGKHSMVGATLYTNTYPCHNCARHIVAAGIQKVVFIEPYLKSHALKLHSDAITEDPSKRDTHVFFQQYDGVAPRNYLKFFRPEGERKAIGGKFVSSDPKTAMPVLQIPLDASKLYEDLILASLLEVEPG